MVTHSTAGHRQLSSTSPGQRTLAPKPFGTSDLVDDTLVALLSFFIVLVAGHGVGQVIARLLRLPLITGYLFFGILAGPFVSALITTSSVELLAPTINAVALTFISFQAGQEIFLPELLPQLKSIAVVLAVQVVATLTLFTVVLTLAAPAFFFGDLQGACRNSIALMFGSIALAISPGTVLALKLELASAGPFTNLMLGSIMTADLVVLVAFSVSRVIASVNCARLDLSLANVVFTMSIVVGNLLVGAVLAAVIIAIFALPLGRQVPDERHWDRDDIAILASSRHQYDSAHRRLSRLAYYVKGFIWLMTGFAFYLSVEIIAATTGDALGHAWEVKLEALLVLMVASCLAGHYGHIRHEMHVILDAAAPFVFLPFFVMTGAALRLDNVVSVLPLTLAFVALRIVGVLVTSFVAGRWLLGLPPRHYKNLWLTMTPQAGVALGLASEVKAMSSAAWTSQFASTIVAAVVVNQVIGPVLCARGIQQSGESQLGSDKADGDRHELCEDSNGNGDRSARRFERRTPKHAIVLGDDNAALEIGAQLRVLGCAVTMPLLDDDLVRRWDQLARRMQLTSELSKAGPDRALQCASPNAVDLVVFTGDGRRVLDQLKLLQAANGAATVAPRLVAITESPEIVPSLRQRGVFCVQASVTLVNATMRVALAEDDHVACQLATETGVAHPQCTATQTLQALTSTSRPDERAIECFASQCRRAVEMNLRHAKRQPPVSRSEELAAPPQVPSRVSMFGRASTSDFFVFTGTSRGGNQNFALVGTPEPWSKREAMRHLPLEQRSTRRRLADPQYSAAHH
ncbi:hypothetical protein P43SY_006930 [Pythium insidiosum]|uniref:Cation/H+ exchanger domain-containing protein n=1 Tax=Pythium insidiosum TaxID=114742 RepID=A0AAD5MEZ7_PYTIN|nr:hypothetical protein P43SY_006930 [Pythium insidiosum]